MATGDISLKFGATGDLTISPENVASDTNLLSGVESNALDIASLIGSGPVGDVLLGGKWTAGTSPTADRQVQVFAVGSIDGTIWPDVFDGTASAETITTANIKNAICKRVATMVTDGTSNRTYHYGPVSLAALFGGVLPPKIVLCVVHNTGVNSNSTGSNHKHTYQVVYEQVAS